MEKFREFLKLEEDNSSVKMLFVYLIIAYIFSVGIRYYWVSQFQNDPMSMWNGHLMINTNDGYAWAEGARDILNGGHTPNDQSAVSQPISQITAVLAKIVPVSFESLILWMPAVFGSLLIFPVLLTGRALGQTRMGFIAALLAGIAWSYYNRTMAGYYDTDLLVIVFPSLVVWGVVLSLISNRNRYLLMTAIFVIAYRWYYGGSYSLLLGIAAAVLFYAIIFDRKNLFNYKLVLFMFAAAYLNTFWEKSITVVGLFILFHFGKEKTEKMILPLLGAVVLYMIFNGALAPIMQKLEQYVFRSAVADDINLKFFSVVQTVREAGAIPFEIFANRISGSMPTFLLALIGTIGLMIRYPVTIITLPMVGLGFMAYSSGLRFTVYAVPFMALGIAFLIVLLSRPISKFSVKIAFLVIATAGVLYPNVKHITEYMVPTVFNNAEVKVLDDLEKRATEEDYVVTWWDYGFPIRYYSKTKTLVDGGKHSGFQNFAPSLILNTNSQIIAAKLARLEVEYEEMRYKDKRTGYNIARMMKDFGFKDPNKFIESLKKDINLPKKTRDIYLYLPNRMLNIFPTVSLFSNMNIVTGERYPRKYFARTMAVGDNPSAISFSDGSILDKRQATLQIGSSQVGVKSFHIVEYDKFGNLRKRTQKLRNDGSLNIIFMKSYNQFLILDDAMLNSTFIQLFVFENYDKDLFEPVTKSPYAKVYKLKI